MAISDFLVSEGMQVFLIALALVIVTLFLIRYLSFYFKYRKVRRENVDLATELKKRLKEAKIKDLDEIIDDEDDEMFKASRRGRLAKESVRAKPLVIPASYEARIGKARARTLKPRRKPRKAQNAAKRKRKNIIKQEDFGISS